MENLNSEIITSLKTLGLDVGATNEDIHSAFRKLARELHPDLTGSKSDFRFKQITGAYNILKNLTPEELEQAQKIFQDLQKDSFLNSNLKEKKPKKFNPEKINSILDKYEQEINNYYTARTPGDESDIAAITFRLKSNNFKVISAALKHSASLVNRVEIRRALTEILKRSDLDEGTAEIIEALPFDDTTRKLIALDVAKYAGQFPTGLIISLIGSDIDSMESFLLHVKPDDIAVILRRWPSGKIMNSNVLRRLLDSNDARVLVPVLGTMKNNFPGLALQYKKRLNELESHSTAAVRAWARKII